MMKLKWTEDEKINNITWLTCASAIGLMLGSLAASTVVKIGRRRAILIASIVAIVGALMQFLINFWSIIIGKIVYGAAAAIMLTGCALYLAETLPIDKIGSHGFAVNLGVTLGISVVLNIGIPVPRDDPDSSYWLIVASIPVVVGGLNFFLWLLCFRNEPIGFCINNAKKSNYKA